MGKKNFYAVRSGREKGIFTSWDECRNRIEGYANAEYKGFATQEEAKAYLSDGTDIVFGQEEMEPSDVGGKVPSKESISDGEAIAYVDGSFDISSGCFSSGLIIFFGKEEVRISHKYDNPSMAEMRNVAGEIMASVEAMRYCFSNGIKKLTIYHDYEGIAAWCNRKWKASKEETQSYRDFYDKISLKMDVEFIKVKGHSGDEYNEVADYLAKEALGLNDLV